MRLWDVEADVPRTLLDGEEQWLPPTTPVYWADPKSGIAYQVQVEILQAKVSSVDDVASIPLASRRAECSDPVERPRVAPYRRDLPRVSPPEYAADGDCHANAHETDLGSAASAVAPR